jgi:hypothetical protein
MPTVSPSWAPSLFELLFDPDLIEVVDEFLDAFVGRKVDEGVFFFDLLALDLPIMGFEMQ